MPESVTAAGRPMPEGAKTLWELLWDYDPNGLLVVDRDLAVQVVNPALCEMLRTREEDLIGRNVGDFLDDADDFRRVWDENRVTKAVEREYPRYGLYVRKVMFPIRDENVVACIMVDVTHEQQQTEEMTALKRETLDRVTQVVNNQMKTAQEIAGLLGETTAETKVSLLSLIDLLRQEGGGAGGDGANGGTGAGD